MKWYEVEIKKNDVAVWYGRAFSQRKTSWNKINYTTEYILNFLRYVEGNLLKWFIKYFPVLGPLKPEKLTGQN